MANTFNPPNFVKHGKHDEPRCPESWWATDKAQADRNEFDRIVTERFPVMQARGVTYPGFVWIE